jgi:nucleotide-binding universal stress UspA family protein
MLKARVTLEERMSRTIVVPLDGSEFAEHAVAAAAGIARSEGARLHLVRAHEAPVIPTSPDVMVPYDAKWDAALRQEEREYLQSVANRISEKWGITTRTEVVDGPPAMAIATYAREMEVDLIVMTTHGRGGLSRMWLGSVADGVIRRGGVPVLLLRASEVAKTDDGHKMDKPLELQRVLIPLDGSDLSEGVIEPAVWLGSLSGAHYTLLRIVLPVPLIRPPLATPEQKLTETVMTEQLAQAREKLEATAARLRQRGLTVDVAVVSDTVPAHAILEWAASNPVDVIALATHGRGGWSRLALGSVADKVLRAANVPVLVFRPDAHLNGASEKHNSAIAAYV